MPKYELMYIVGSHISDDEIPKVAEEVKKFIESDAGIIEKHEELGKKKLADPIKKTRNGYYVVDNFSMPADKINEFEHKIRTNQSIIRHLIVSMDEALIQMEKDRVLQAKLKIVRPMMEEEKEKGKPVRPVQKSATGKIQIDLDAEIEKALESKDLK
jgi:small subunit ribosomal protein S6